MRRIDFGQDLSGIGDRLRRVRELAGLTQGKMGRLVGVNNQSTYGNYEAGRSLPLDFVIHFHGVCEEQLGISFDLDWLLRGEGRGPEEEPEPAAGAGRAGAPAAPDSLAATWADLWSAESGDIDRQISEEMEVVKEVVKQFLRRRVPEREPEHVHPFLRSVPFFVIDQMSAARYASPGVYRLLKAKPETLIGQSSMRYLPAGEMERLIPEQIRAMREKGYWAGEVVVQASDLEEIPCLHVQILIRDDDGTPCMGNILLPMREINETRSRTDLRGDRIMRHVKWESSVAQKPRS